MPLTHSAIDTQRLVHNAGVRHEPVVAEELAVGIVSAVDFRAVEHDRLDDESGFWERIWPSERLPRQARRVTRPASELSVRQENLADRSGAEKTRRTDPRDFSDGH